MAEDLTTGIVRILTADGSTVGTGFVVTDDSLIATCAHVVQGAGAGPGDTVRVAFHATGEERDAQVEPAWWRGPDAEDVAILRLDGPVPEGVISLSLGSSAGVEGHVLTTFGFPDPKPVEGMAGKCEVVGRTTERGFPVLQLRSSEVTPGFSGAPVLDTITRRVVGMVTAITVPDQYGRLPETAFITPTETLRAVCPELQLSDLCPYQGLAAFTEDHAEFFFGRDPLVADLVDHLRGNPRFLAVVGPSGSGKSSVVRAGLFPALRRGEVPGSGEWHLLSFRPGADPFAALTTAGLDVPQKGDLSAAIRAFLKTHPQVKRLVLFANQFEELFTLCPQPVQEQFLRQLAALLEGDLPVTVVLTLRADFYGHLLRYRPLADWLEIGQVNVLSMGPEELRAAVEDPATRLGLRFEPGLVETIVEEAGEADHPLPLLESALTRLWEKREDGTLTHAEYQKVGRVAGAISQWAEDAYTQLAPQERPLTRRVFTRLVHYGEGEVADTRQQQSLSELAARPKEREPLHQLVQRLADARLLVTGGDPGTETVGIIHDALLQQWNRLKRWMTEQREFHLWRQRLDERLQEWEEKGQDEGALLRGALLAEAGRWLGERSDDLNLDEQAYIRASKERKIQEEQQWKELYEEAERQRRIAVARQLAAHAQMAWGNTGTSLVRSTLLAVESLRCYPTLEGDQAIRRGLNLLPRLVAQVEHMDSVSAVSFSPNGHWVASGSSDGTVRVWEAATGHEVAQMEHEDGVTSISFSSDGRWVVSGSWDRTARVWEATTGREVAQVTHEKRVVVVAFSPNGKLVASGDDDGIVCVWEAATGREVSRMMHEYGVEALAFNPDGQWIASGGSDCMVRVWEATTGQEVAQMEHPWLVMAVAFSPDGKLVASGSEDFTMRVWEVATGQDLVQIEHEGVVTAVVFSPDGGYVASATASNGGTVRVWEIGTGREVAQMVHDGGVYDVTFTPNGRWLATVSGDGTARVWEAATGREMSRMVHESWGASASFSPDGQWVVSGGGDRIARVWEAITRQEATRMEHWEPVNMIAFSPDGRWLASAAGSEDSMTQEWEMATGRVWETVTGQEVSQVTHQGPVRAVAFSPDGRWVATGSDDGTVCLWEASTGREITWMRHDGGVRAVTFSPDGLWLATASGDGTARVWEVTTGQEVTCVVHGNWVEAVAFNPTGQLIASGGWDGRVRVWKTATGREVVQVDHENAVELVAFSSTGQWVASASSELNGILRPGVLSLPTF